MLKNLLVNRFTFHSIHIERSIKSLSSFNLDIQMKQLNDENQFNKSLLLFDEYQKKFDQIPSSQINNSSIKSLSKIGRFSTWSSDNSTIFIKIRF